MYKLNKGFKMKSLLVTSLLAITIFTGCTNKNDARKALVAEGYTKIEYTGYGWFACGKEDFYHTNFKATNREGNIVEGTVCSGLVFKGATIRY